MPVHKWKRVKAYTLKVLFIFLVSLSLPGCKVSIETQFSTTHEEETPQTTVMLPTPSPTTENEESCSGTFRFPNSYQITAIASGAFHNLILLDDGSIWMWGFKSDRVLGNPCANIDECTIFRVPNLPDIIAIDSFSFLTAALSRDGHVFVWKDEEPEKIEGLENIVSISVGMSHLLALDDNGYLWAWGNNDYYQLGDGTDVTHTEPIKLEGLPRLTAISAGVYHNMAIDENANVWAWGSNYYGESGDPSFSEYVKAPQIIEGFSDITEVSAGSASSIAIMADGTVWEWGYASSKNPSTTPLEELRSAVPTMIPGIWGASEITSGLTHHLLIDENGYVYAWGNNEYHQLGVYPAGHGVSVEYPKQVGIIEDVIMVSIGDSHSLGVRSDGTLWGWGSNTQCQLGSPQIEYSTLEPVQIEFSQWD